MSAIRKAGGIITLEQADIPYVGAGRNISEAEQPVFFNINGVTIAYVAATRAEKNVMTPEAGKDSPGVLYTYDETEYLKTIAYAKEHSDYCIASVHWGTEYSNNADKKQRSLAKKFIDAGADAVIGTHTHCLQGIEYYKGKPVMYSLGNFWFNEKSLNSCLFGITLRTDSTADNQGTFCTLESVTFVPCRQEGYHTFIPDTAAGKQKIIDYEKKLSFGVDISSAGIVTQAEI